jgi:hypothetical protein
MPPRPPMVRASTHPTTAGRDSKQFSRRRFLAKISSPKSRPAGGTYRGTRSMASITISRAKTLRRKVFIFDNLEIRIRISVLHKGWVCALEGQSHVAGTVRSWTIRKRIPKSPEGATSAQAFSQNVAPSGLSLVFRLSSGDFRPRLHAFAPSGHSRCKAHPKLRFLSSPHLKPILADRLA